jgi:diguanylate cyclase (GGDEF)-like protein
MLQISPTRPVWHRLVAYAALGVLIAGLWYTYRKGRLPRADWLLAGLLLFAAGSALVDPMAAVSLYICLVTVLTLYGSVRATVVRTVAGFGAFLATVGFYQVAEVHKFIPGQWVGAVVVVPSCVLAVVMLRKLYNVLLRQERTVRRQSLLASTGSQLLDQTDLKAVSAIVGSAIHTLCMVSEGVGAVLVRRGDGRLTVVESGGLPRSVRGAVLAGTDDQQLNQLVEGHRHWRTMELADSEGHEILAVGGVSPVPDEEFDVFSSLLAQYALAVVRCTSHAELFHLAHHDQLTGLITRARFLACLEEAHAAGTIGAVLVVDLDYFRQVNDAHGHDAGDRLLISVAARLRTFGESPVPAARLGSNDFAVTVADPGRAGDLAEQLSRWLQDPMMVAHPTGASIGIAVADPTLTASDLLRCASTAMYAAKASGHNQIERFTPERHGDLAELRLIERDLPAAAATGAGLLVFYQPHVDLATRRCVGVEALVRWQHPTLGLLQPVKFIPVAERASHIIGIGTHVLRVACQQAAAWSTMPGCEDFQVAVNVAGPQLHDPALVDIVADALMTSGLPASRLTLELTESGRIDTDQARAQIDALAELGARISIDDFGTGFASLSTLHTIKAHQIKIDRSFISGPHHVRGHGMVQLIVAAGQALGMQVVAEGIETEEQSEVIRMAGVPLAQGYLFSRPIPAAEFPGWLLDFNAAMARR